MVEGRCEFCGTTFKAHACKKRRFCSSSCSSKWTHRHGGWSEKKPGRKKTGRVRPCEQCGAEVYVRPWQEKAGEGRFCNVTCYNAWQSRLGTVRPCGWCGKGMRLQPGNSESRKFCSWACQVEGRRKKALEEVHNGRRVALDGNGYIRIWEPQHPNSYDGWVLQHRFVMEQHLGRQLETAEHVHHLDADKTNNVVENLVVMGAGDHQRETVKQTTERRRAEADELTEYRKRFGPLQ